MEKGKVIAYPPKSLQSLIESAAKRKGLSVSAYITMVLADELEYNPELDAKLSNGE